MRSILPGQTVVVEDNEEIQFGGRERALAEYCPKEAAAALKLWRKAVAQVVDDGMLSPTRAVIRRLWKEMGGRGDAEQAFQSDVRDYKTVRKGEDATARKAYESWVETHGSRKDIIEQIKSLQASLKDLRRMIKRHDSLRQVHSLTAVQGRLVKAQNRRLWPESS